MKVSRNFVVMVGIICITAIEVTALLTGLDGQLFLSSIAGISGLVGYMYGKSRREQDDG